MTGLADAVVARMARQRDLLAAMQEQCAAIRVRATSPDRAVTVEVDATGAMTDLTMGGAATRLGAQELADLIVNIAQTAAKAAVDRRNHLVEQFNSRYQEMAREPLRASDGTIG
ncbi:YbaB/EbfC family nucleoid-associated protein [Mycolicibacterium goodii]|uniref:YbaB/EbfC family DNA-binding protein n=1 Tax=Mycolicibacterium goodii TaxID=134601 RepID=A0A0K0X2Y0_MYCGD|nr:hypothetical protein AFA91_06880 [Mycolicibacterium goodii]